MPKHQKSRVGSDSGFSLISTIIGLAMILTSVTMLSNSVIANRKTQASASTRSEFKEFESLLQSTVKERVSAMMKTINTGTGKGTCDDAGLAFKATWPVTLPGIEAKVDLLSPDRDKLALAPYESDQTALAALTRCQKQTFESSNMLTGRNKLYFCLKMDPAASGLDVEGKPMTGQPTFVEVSFNLMDLAKNQGSTCGELKDSTVASLPGGLVYYTIYWTKARQSKNATDFKRHSGVFYAPIQ